MSDSLLPQLAAQIGGGVGAAVLDRKYADKSVQLGPITLTPGAMAALGLTALAMLGVKIPGGASVRNIVADMAGGALVYEGTKLGEQQAVPLIEKAFPGLLGGSAAPAALPEGGPAAGEDFVGDLDDPYLATGLPDGDDYGLGGALEAYRGAFGT